MPAFPRARRTPARRTPASRTPASRVRRGLGALLVAPLALGVLAGCSEGSVGLGAPAPSSATPTATTTTSPSASASGPSAGSAAGAAVPRFERYVALGDSYTAAPLVPDTDTTNGCLRSTNNYPALVAAALPGTELVDVSCSGADSASMVGFQQTNGETKPPQFDALTEDTDLVTIGIGGNDFNLFATLVGTCAQLRSSDPTGSPCSDRYSDGASDELTRQLDDIRSHVAAVVAGIRKRAPRATVIVVGYPQIIPPRGNCPDLLPLALGDYPFARRISAGLADAVRKGARKAEFVDLFGPSAGHDICSDHPWINGANTDPARALAFHPFAVEQKAAAELVLAKLG
jgi:lysophospholipase L1-like esterase